MCLCRSQLRPAHGIPTSHSGLKGSGGPGRPSASMSCHPGPAQNRSATPLNPRLSLHGDGGAAWPQPQPRPQPHGITTGLNQGRPVHRRPHPKPSQGQPALRADGRLIQNRPLPAPGYVYDMRAVLGPRERKGATSPNPLHTSHSCMHTCAHTHSFTPTHTHVCTHTHIHTHAYILTCACAWPRTTLLHTYVRTSHLCTHWRAQPYTHAQVRTTALTPTCARRHRYTHAHTFLPCLSLGSRH